MQSFCKGFLVIRKLGSNFLDCNNSFVPLSKIHSKKIAKLVEKSTSCSTRFEHLLILSLGVGKIGPSLFLERRESNRRVLVCRAPRANLKKQNITFMTCFVTKMKLLRRFTAILQYLDRLDFPKL